MITELAVGRLLGRRAHPSCSQRSSRNYSSMVIASWSRGTIPMKAPSICFTNTRYGEIHDRGALNRGRTGDRRRPSYGTVPGAGLEHIAVGMEGPINAIKKEMQQVATSAVASRRSAENTAPARPSCHGSSFAEAERLDFATAHVTLSAQETRLYKPDELYRAIARELTLPGVRTCPRLDNSSNAGSLVTPVRFARQRAFRMRIRGTSKPSSDASNARLIRSVRRRLRSRWHSARTTRRSVPRLRGGARAPRDPRWGSRRRPRGEERSRGSRKAREATGVRIPYAHSSSS